MNTSMPNKIYIAASGMITPIGENSETTIAAVNAGINRYYDSQFVGKYSYPIKLASIPDDLLPKLKKNLSDSPIKGRHMRMISIASIAINEVLTKIALDHAVPLFLATSESITDCDNGIDNDFLIRVINQSDANIDIKNSRLFDTGRAGGIQAISLVFDFFKSTGQDYALVGGVDSYVDPNILGCLDEQDRVLTEESMDGFVPGEGASFILFVSERIKNKFQNIKNAVFIPGVCQEEGHLYSEEPMLGNALTDVFRNAIEPLAGKKIKTIYGSLNGENFQSKELGIAIMRNSKTIDPEHSIEHPADCYGDLGAATAIALLTIANENTANNTSLVFCSSDMALRGAVCLSTLL